MWIGNVLLVLLNLPLIGIWVRMLRIPYQVLFPMIILFAAIGTLLAELQRLRRLRDRLLRAPRLRPRSSAAASRRRCCSASSSGPLLEENLRRALIISRGDPSVFLTRPISAALLALAVAALVVAVLPTIRKRREEVFAEDEP